MTARELIEKIQHMIDNKEISEDAEVLVGYYWQVPKDGIRCDEQGNIRITVS